MTDAISQSVPIDAAPAPGTGRWWRWLLAASILAFCALYLDLGAVWQTLGRVSAGWILLILALWTIDRILMGVKWLVLLRALQVRVKLWPVVRIFYQGNFAGTFLPSSLGGDILRAHWVSRLAGPSSTHAVYASLLMEKMIGFLSALNWALVGAGFYFLAYGGQSSLGWMVGLPAGALLGNGLFLFSLRPGVYSLVKRLFRGPSKFRIFDFLDRLSQAYSRYSHERRALALNAALTAVEHGMQLLIVLAMARSLSIEAQALPLLAITAIHMLVYRLPISPDGWGVGEATAIGLYGLIGVSAESAFALAFLSHVLQMLVVLPGLWFLYRRRSLW